MRNSSPKVVEYCSPRCISFGLPGAGFHLEYDSSEGNRVVPGLAEDPCPGARRASAVRCNFEYCSAGSRVVPDSQEPGISSVIRFGEQRGLHASSLALAEQGAAFYINAIVVIHIRADSEHRVAGCVAGRRSKDLEIAIGTGKAKGLGGPQAVVVRTGCVDVQRPHLELLVLNSKGYCRIGKPAEQVARPLRRVDLIRAEVIGKQDCLSRRRESESVGKRAGLTIGIGHYDIHGPGSVR